MRRLMVGIASLALLLTAGCPHVAPSTPAVNVKQTSALGAELEGAPDWVKGDCRVRFKDASSKPVCGVGSISGTSNPSLAKSGATARARTELARALETSVKAMMKDYQATSSGSAGQTKSSNDEQYVSDVSKQIADTSLSGVRFEDSWISPSGTYFALVVLDAQSFSEALGQMHSLDEAIRQAVISRADRAFYELDHTPSR